MLSTQHRIMQTVVIIHDILLFCSLATAPCGTLFGHGFINSYGQLRHGRTDWLWNIHSASNTRIKVKIHWAYMDNCDTDYFMVGCMLHLCNSLIYILRTINIFILPL